MNDENNQSAGGATDENLTPPAGDEQTQQQPAQDLDAADQSETEQHEQIVDPAFKRDAAVKDFVKKSHPVELLKAIEEQARVLKLLIHGIPDGVAHGWHSLAAEISSRGF